MLDLLYKIPVLVMAAASAWFVGYMIVMAIREALGPKQPLRGKDASDYYRRHGRNPPDR